MGTLEIFEPYSMKSSFAERFMEKQTIFNCNLCSEKIPPEYFHVNEHCATKDHYLNLKKFLRKKKKKSMDELKPLNEAEVKTKSEEKKEESKEREKEKRINEADQ